MDGDFDMKINQVKKKKHLGLILWYGDFAMKINQEKKTLRIDFVMWNPFKSQVDYNPLSIDFVVWNPFKLWDWMRYNIKTQNESSIC